MRWLLLLSVVLGAGRTSDPPGNLALIDEFNGCIQLRFETADGNFGMNRMASSNSLGEHFRPRFNVTSDFVPEEPQETKTLAAMEKNHLQVGLYLVGRESQESPLSAPNFRAMKGPAAITAGTPRPAWYPTARNPAAPPDAMPDWKVIYPLAQRAMRSFEDGGAGFEMKVDSWQIAARPVFASQQRCVICHNRSGGLTVALNHPLGGVLYAFRRDPAHL